MSGEHFLQLPQYAKKRSGATLFFFVVVKRFAGTEFLLLVTREAPTYDTLSIDFREDLHAERTALDEDSEISLFNLLPTPFKTKNW